ncbi:uncharacterized protein EV420DRAFT_1648031 [Desarmillaria tabescens]|uniref:Uncharacterized protein n=1 Tax=Armillaria tabescens TaxID=1929756 RepID=A0AA39MUE6_ARMTA|nr:uncharacterized protein EV420DRAFT_1648031 [Desarmillaria tabescens]KAK0446598.1 hypothetical protein EV420DRAFT_1648031 [Desarmillaria tabescens]
MSTSNQKMPRPMARDAPRFDGDKSENIRHFLSQMEDLFSDCSITDDAERKKQLVRYADADTEEEWKLLDEYDNGTFAKFKEAIVKNYPEAQDVESGTVNRLTCITQVVVEADDIALNTSGIYGVTEASPLEISSSARKDSSGLKIEVEEVKQQVASLLDHLDLNEKQSDARQKQLLEAFQQSKNTGMQQSRSRNSEGSTASANDTKKHVTEGLLKIVNDKIVMGDRNLVPREPAQKAPFERVIDYFAKKKSGQLFFEGIDSVAGVYQLSAPLSSEDNSVYANHVADPQDDIINKLRRDVQQLQQNSNLAPPQFSSSNGSAQQQPAGFLDGPMKARRNNKLKPMTVSLEKLEDHFKNKGKQKEQTITKKQVVKNHGLSDDEVEIIEKSGRDTSKETSKPISKPKTRVTVEEASDDEEGTYQQDLPYRNVKAISFKPLPVDSRPRTEDISKKVRDPLENDRIPAYKNILPIHKDGRAQEVASRVLEAPISINAKELLDLSPAVRKELAKLMAKKRIATKPVVQSAYGVGEDHLDSAPLPFSSENLNLDNEEWVKALKFDCDRGSLIVGDPYLQYLDTLEPGETLRPVIVGGASTSLRAIFPLINGTGHEECVVDGGSQIVSMAEHIATSLGIGWDPDITIHMQSANGSLVKTLGLAKNVPFLFQDIVVYLQVHVIDSPAYKVLLGRPFDVVTESLIKNNSDGGQVITITDPNTGRRCTIPTFTRGTTFRMTRPVEAEGFRSSKI